MSDISAAQNRVVVEVLDLFDRFGSSNYDEGVTLTDHSLQTAALARAEGASDVLVLASLLHDVGHFLQAQDRGNENYLADDWAHDTVAAEWLRPRFGDEVADAVGHHVSAKRWLCASEPSYFDSLSAASVASLAAQGGPFTESEAIDWREQPGAEAAIRLRRWDDDGKVAGLNIAPLSDYTELLQRFSEAGAR